MRGGRRMPEFQVEKVPINSEDDWITALGDKPWDTEAMRAKTLEYISVKIEVCISVKVQVCKNCPVSFVIHHQRHIAGR